MYGNNPVGEVRRIEQGYKVHSIFYTIQGEGPWAGFPAIFVRFSDCNLRCHFCDTEFEAGSLYSFSDLLTTLVGKMHEHRCSRLVFTGGEPMLQDLPALLSNFAVYTNETPQIQIETAGTIWPCGMEKALFLLPTILVCSPKTPRVHPAIDTYAHAWKYIIRALELDPKDGLPIGSTQINLPMTRMPRVRLHRPSLLLKENIYVQPCDEPGDPEATKMNMVATVGSALKFGYRLSLQTHKIVGLP
jgi:organic radical activating enzyme